jgi:hypothetical protein
MNEDLNQNENLGNVMAKDMLIDHEVHSSSLARRYSRVKAKPEVAYEFTTDRGILQQYYRLREEMFISVWGLDHFSGEKDAFDDVSDVVVARIGNQCIGGCRLTFSSHDKNKRNILPLERGGQSLASFVPELPIADMNCVEVSRLAILPEFQNSVVMLKLINKMIQHAVTRKAHYAFAMSPQLLARNYRKAVRLFGMDWQIRSDITIPDREEFEGIQMVLSQLDLAKAYQPRTIKQGVRVTEGDLLTVD